jgi:hypothetical protein
MPRTNRVDPFGNLHAVPQRGTLLGNRGNLHNPDGTIVRRFMRKAGVACELSYNDRKRTVMAPGQYTELFFLDEATAFAAGHRPCGTCRKAALADFKQCWRRAKGLGEDAPVDLKDLDEVLHRERTVGVWPAVLETLPDGAMVQIDRDGGPNLWWRGRLLAWSFEGYRPAVRRPTEAQVLVITPRCLVDVLRAGYPISTHASASV